MIGRVTPRWRIHRGALGHAVVIIALVAGTFAVLATTLGQSRPVTSNPPDRAVLAKAPAAVDLTFPTAPDITLSHVTVFDDLGSPVNSGAMTQQGSDTLRQPVSISAQGDVTVVYHVVFDDGGESKGSLHFSVGTQPGTADDADHADQVAAAGEHEHGIDPLSALMLGADAAVVLAVLVLLFLTRRRPGHDRRPEEAMAGTERASFLRPQRRR
jgi:methionine-rich copper-binding protein CopC